MGVWRWASKLMANMMSKFPNTVIRYMEKKRPNMNGCNFNSSENPRRKNCETPVRFLIAMCWWWLWKKKEIAWFISTQKHHYSCSRNATIYILPSIIAFNILFMDLMHLKEPPVASLVSKVVSQSEFPPTCYVYYNFNEKFFHTFE